MNNSKEVQVKLLMQNSSNTGNKVMPACPTQSKAVVN